MGLAYKTKDVSWTVMMEDRKQECSSLFPDDLQLMFLPHLGTLLCPFFTEHPLEVS